MFLEKRAGDFSRFFRRGRGTGEEGDSDVAGSESAEPVPRISAKKTTNFRVIYPRDEIEAEGALRLFAQCKQGSLSLNP